MVTNTEEKIARKHMQIQPEGWKTNKYFLSLKGMEVKYEMDWKRKKSRKKTTLLYIVE